MARALALVVAATVATAMVAAQDRVKVTLHASPNCATAPLFTYSFTDRTCSALPQRPGVSVFFNCDPPVNGESGGGSVRACDSTCDVCSEATAFRNDQVRDPRARQWHPGALTGRCGHTITLARHPLSPHRQCISGLPSMDLLTVKATCSQRATSGAGAAHTSAVVMGLGVAAAVVAMVAT